jgi:mono/diheme cytochrome c family protein
MGDMRAKVRAAKVGGLLLLAGLCIGSLGDFLVGAARAQIHPDAKTGHEIAGKLCTSCHIVDSEAAGATVPADVPSFEAIANKAGQTAEAIAGRIVIPHPPMPQIQLTREEIGDIAVYIMSLRKGDAP